MQTQTLLSAIIAFLISFAATAQTDRQPFADIGKKVKVLTLTNGKYEEFFDDDSLQRIGTALINIYTLKVVKLQLTEEEQSILDNSASTRFLSVDPLSNSYPELTPYQYASNTPIWAIDIDGLEGGIASPMGGQNVVDATTAQKAVNWPTQPASLWMRLGLAAQMNAIQQEEVYNENSYPTLTKGQYVFSSMAQAQINHGQALMSEPMIPNRKIPQQPHVEVEINIPKPKVNIINSEEVHATVNKQVISIKNNTPQVGEAFGSQSFTITEGHINLNSRSVTNGTFDFVVTNDGKLVLGKGHYNLSGNANSVEAAGQIRVFKGKVMDINNNSGHYKPTVEEAKNFGKILKNAGIDVSGANLNLYDAAGKKIETVKQ